MMQQYKPYYVQLSKLPGKYLNYFVSGFVDGEGSFSVSLTKQKYSFKGLEWRWILNPTFQVYQHGDNLDILELLKNEVFKTGRIHRKTSPFNVYTYTVENHKTLEEKIIPFFRKYRLATKDKDFQIFSEIIMRMARKEHLKIDGFKQIVNLAFTMNANGKQRKYSKEYIFATLENQFKFLKNPQRLHARIPSVRDKI